MGPPRKVPYSKGMASGLPARVVVLCTLLCGVTIARAERRPVAVIDLSGDPATTQLARDFNPVLLSHPDLQPIADPSIPGELLGEFRDEDQDHIKDASTSKGRAEDQLARYQFVRAEAEAAGGLHELDQATPGSSTSVLYSQLAFIRAQALLGIPSQTSEARVAFAIAHRLDPSFVPDAARYLPDVVQAFAAAKKAWPGKATLAVAGTGRLWLDGKEVGTAPAELEVESGPHVVWLTGADRETASAWLVAEPANRAEIKIDNKPVSRQLKVRRARAALRQAPDPAARSTAMKLIAELVGVKDAVLLTSANGKIIVQTWNAGNEGYPARAERNGAPGFSAFQEKRQQTPLELLSPLTPPRARVEEVKTPPITPVHDDRRWYQKRYIQASIVVGVIAAIVASYYIYNGLTDDTVPVDPNVTPATRSVITW